jgi:hypothetical protein
MLFEYETGVSDVDAREGTCVASVCAEFASVNWLCREKSLV